MTEVNTIYCQNCLDTMGSMPDGFVDLTITSPPYNMNLRIRNGAYCSRQIVKEFSTKYHNFDDNLPLDEFYKLHSSILKELLRVSNIVFYNIQIVTGSKRAFFKMIGEFSDNLKDIIVWDKVNAQPAMQSSVLNRQSELLLIFEQPKKAISRQFSKCNFKRGTLNDVWYIKRGSKISNSHGATFPIELCEKIICNFSNENDIIYDPFMGTGTVAKAAKQNNRRYIGSELSKDYCEIAEKRLLENI